MRIGESGPAPVYARADLCIFAFVPYGEGLPETERYSSLLKIADRRLGLRCVGFVQGTSCRLPPPRPAKRKRRALTKLSNGETHE